MVESESAAAMRRALRRATFHLLRAALEGVKAVEAFVDEMAKVGREDEEGDEGDTPRRVRIDVE
ncbi:MAG TPA: hypothetical protein VJ938_10390 [Acidimicrobiia bacterium]|nr:hypothetical protein [Acidimicrobiia bacterium]